MLSILVGRTSGGCQCERRGGGPFLLNSRVNQIFSTYLALGCHSKHTHMVEGEITLPTVQQNRL